METPNLKKFLRRIRSLANFWIAKETRGHRQSKRLWELDIILSMLPPNGRLLEIGAGTGWQSRALADRGYEVHAIDLPISDETHLHLRERAWPITDYDGKHIPF